ncbi:TPA: hypothetical protein NV714_001705 [Escherichia coli]|nr:hypothetical protein [Escherichia coli]
MNTELKHYIRTSFPEYSDLTTLEIFIMKHLDRNFMSAVQQTYYTSHVINPTIIKDLIIIDLSDYFIRHKEKYAFDFLSEDSFLFKFYFSDKRLAFNFNLYEQITEKNSIFFKDNLINHNVAIYYKEEEFIYNKYNLKEVIEDYISFIKKDYSHEETIFSFLYSYIKEHTDLNRFFNLEPLTSQNSKMKITEYSMFYLTNNICKHIYIEKKEDIFYISDHNANILYQKDLKLITKSNFSTYILEPLKDILNNMNRYRKKNFIQSWENDVFQYMSTVIDKQDMTALKAKIYRPKLKSEFLNNIIYYQKPVIEIFFILNNKEVSSLKMDEDYDYHIKDIKTTYQVYKDFLNINAENLELKNLIGTTKIANKKKRI